jgi:hypothetical protein
MAMTQHKGEVREPRFDGVLGARGTVGLPLVRTLSDEYRDVAEPVDSDRVPPPAHPGTAARLGAWIRGLTRRG